MTSPDAQARLKACPFCGEPPFAQSSFMDADLKQACYIACRTCDVSPEGCYRKAEEWPQAIAAWNSRTPDAQPSSDWWQRFCTIMDKTDDEGFSPEIEQELMELHAGIQPSSTEGEVERLRSALELFIEQAVFDEYTHRVSVDEFVLSKARAAIAAQVPEP